MNKNNNQAWKTKYGPRRVRVEAPTLGEAIFAAQGLTDDPAEQTEIAAALMGLPPDKVRAEMPKHALAIARECQVGGVRRSGRRAAQHRGRAQARPPQHQAGRPPAADVVAGARRRRNYFSVNPRSLMNAVQRVTSSRYIRAVACASRPSGSKPVLRNFA